MLNLSIVIALTVLSAQRYWTEPFRVRWSDNDVTVESKETFPGGKVDVRVWSDQHGPRKCVYKLHSDALYLTNVSAWHIDSDSDEALWLTFEYGSGASNHIEIIGPNVKGKWSTLLEFEASNCVRFPPETIDLRGAGTRDILALTDAVSDHKTGLMDKQKSRVTVWRWSSRQGKYVRIATCRYADRLKVQGQTKR